MPAHRLPAAKQVRDLLATLIGRDVTVAPGGRFAPGPAEPGASAVYIDDSVRTSAVIGADLALAAYTSAAIGLVPATVARAAIGDGELGEELAENLHEIMNVAGSLFNTDEAPHVRLHMVYPPGHTPTADVSTYARTLGHRLDLRVAVAGYGPGRLAIVLV